MNEVSEIKRSAIYADLTDDDIADLMAEAARVDELFHTGRASTMYLTSMTAAAFAVGNWDGALPATAA